MCTSDHTVKKYRCIFQHTYICTYIHTYKQTLHYITLHYITLHYITLHYIHPCIHAYIYIYIYTLYNYNIIIYRYILISKSQENATSKSGFHTKLATSKDGESPCDNLCQGATRLDPRRSANQRLFKLQASN